MATGAAEAGLLTSALSAAKKGQEAAAGEAMVWSPRRVRVLQQSPVAKGVFQQIPILFFIIVLCWHHNRSGRRERAREKTNVLISAF